MDPQTEHVANSQPCYRGKWTDEEEQYFYALREEFRAGTLDIPNGITLRFYAAKQLGCKPKRISKKVCFFRCFVMIFAKR